MTGCKISLFVITVSCCMLAAYSFPPLRSMQKRSMQRLCGRNLVQALALVCDSLYYDPSEYEKRNYKGDWDVFRVKSKPRTTLMDSKTTTDLLASTESFERDTRGIIDECCKKSCTIYELASYCE